MNSALIRQFVTVVPVCPLNSPIYAILRLVKPESEGKVLVVDRAQKPIGVVAIYDLLLGLAMLPDWSEPLESLHQSKLATVCAALAHAYPMVRDYRPLRGSIHKIDGLVEDMARPITHQSLQDCLDSVTHYGGRSPLRPIRCILDNTSLLEFRLKVISEQHYQNQSPSSSGFAAPSSQERTPEWVVLNSYGAGLGLLAQQQVWQHLALGPISSPISEQGCMGSGTTDTAVPPSPLSPVSCEDDASQWSWPTEDLWNVFVQRLGEEQTRTQQLTNECYQWQARLEDKDDLLAYVSHEIKNPLTAVMGLAELLVLFPSAQLTERQQHYAHLIHLNSRRLMKLMTGLLDLLHVETQQLSLTMHSVAIAPLCEVAYQQAQEEYFLFMDQPHHPSGAPSAVTAPIQSSLFKPGFNIGDNPLYGRTSQGTDPISALPDPTPSHPIPSHPVGFAPATDQSLVITIQPGAERIVADENRLKRLLTSLLTTALQLTRPQDAITVRVETSNGWMAIRLTYPTVELMTEDQNRIFQRLELLEGSTSPRFDRVGFRLTLALRLAEQHGGTLSFLCRSLPPGNDHPQARQQMEMAVLLPTLISPDSPRGDRPFSAVVDEHKLRVVVVDDDPTRIVAIADAVSALGYWVAIARSGREALNKVLQLNPAIILLNPAMAYVQDMDLLTVLHQNSQTRSVPIIATTTISAVSQDRIKLDGYLSYPLDKRTIHQMIRALTQATATTPPSIFSPPITLLYCNPAQWVEPDWADATAPPSLTERDENDSPGPSFEDCSHSIGDILESIDLNTILHPYHCRVIEVDSIDQAELLARVWQPNLVVCGGSTLAMSKKHYAMLHYSLTAFTQCEDLARLPLVTLTPQVTELAHQLGLCVFPCLDPLLPVLNPDGSTTSIALIQAIQVAVNSHPL